uniref:Leucine rich repeat containing 61 n=1 Tax=Anas platyrhynchos platyrhynchos TaxID=8840 RepID=A0A493SX53_ANAPP
MAPRLSLSSVWALLSATGLNFGQTCAVPGVGLGEPCGSLPARDVSGDSSHGRAVGTAAAQGRDWGHWWWHRDVTGDTGRTARMEAHGEKGEEGAGLRITAQLLKASSGQFALDSILLLRLRGRGIADLGCLGDCAHLEWLDLSGNSISQLGPLAGLKQLAVLNLSRNRVSSLEPLGSCENLQSLNLAGNLVSSLQQLRCLAGLRRLESLRLRDALGQLSNPVCAASAAYRAALAEALPGLKAIDGERVSGRGSELFQLCRDLDGSPGAGPGPAPPRAAQPWVQASFWEPPPPRRSSIIEEAYKQ